MFAPFEQESAFLICKKLCSELDSGVSKLVRVSKLSAEREGQGVMLGAVKCTDSDGSEVYAYTVSGSAYVLNRGGITDMVFVPPIVSPKDIAAALSENDAQIHSLTDCINEAKKNGRPYLQMSQQRTLLTSASLKKVNALYRFHCADKKIRTLKEICAQYNNGSLAPTGTGDCCAPKLLDYAYSHNLVVQSMCEVFYNPGLQNANSVPCPPCDSRCAILLPAMLGLKIIYRDDRIIVVDKQSGLLSIPGRGEDKQDCITSRLKRLFPNCIQQPSVHRLDMETSGLMVLAFDAEAHRNLSRQFQEGTVKKEYVALLDGVLAKKGIPEEGTTTLFFRLDIDNRPHQIWDDVYGKKAVTSWKILDVERYTAPDGSVRNVTRVLFKPQTGRTHQLRLASADTHGFGIPIVGDTLYGKCEEGERLMLHARYLAFDHPTDGRRMEFQLESGF